MSKVLQFILNPHELRSVIQLLWFRQPLHSQNLGDEIPTLKKCYELLDKTSRSFSSVIKELHPELRNAVALFYLILRALDTIEDDMTIDSSTKISMLRNFDQNLKLKDWNFNGNGQNEKDRVVLVEFHNILIEYHKLKTEYQDVIKDITYKMGNGMADFITFEDFNINGLKTIKDYDLYCHYVAGVVGEGLSKLMILAEFTDDSVVKDNCRLAESMGLFLQKVNIIRDYHEDIVDGRSFWPKEIWSKHTNDLTLFHKDRSKKVEEKGLACINELVLNALGHAKDVLTYLSLVKDPSCFNFCAIPQTMAIATLAIVYNNPKVLHQNVKIRKGEAASLILNSRTLPDVVRIFRKYVQIINHKSSVTDPNYLRIGIKCGEIEQFCELMFPSKGAIPLGAKKTSNEINQNIIKRQNIDNQIKDLIKLETVKCNMFILFALILIVIFSYFVM